VAGDDTIRQTGGESFDVITCACPLPDAPVAPPVDNGMVYSDPEVRPLVDDLVWHTLVDDLVRYTRTLHILVVQLRCPGGACLRSLVVPRPL
jgi:hypothetical protein